MGDILVVGKRDSILGFKTIGLDMIYWENNAQSVAMIKDQIEKGSKIVFVTESIFVELKTFIDEYFGKMYPVFIPIPEVSGSQGIGYENIRNLVIKALGTDVLGK